MLGPGPRSGWERVCLGVRGREAGGDAGHPVTCREGELDLLLDHLEGHEVVLLVEAPVVQQEPVPLLGGKPVRAAATGREWAPRGRPAPQPPSCPGSSSGPSRRLAPRSRLWARGLDRMWETSPNQNRNPGRPVPHPEAWVGGVGGGLWRVRKLPMHGPGSANHLHRALPLPARRLASSVEPEASDSAISPRPPCPPHPGPSHSRQGQGEVEALAQASEGDEGAGGEAARGHLAEGLLEVSGRAVALEAADQQVDAGAPVLADAGAAAAGARTHLAVLPWARGGRQGEGQVSERRWGTPPHQAMPPTVSGDPHSTPKLSQHPFSSSVSSEEPQPFPGPWTLLTTSPSGYTPPPASS